MGLGNCTLDLSFYTLRGINTNATPISVPPGSNQ